MSDDAVFSLAQQPVHLGLGATTTAQPPFDGMAWYEEYAQRVAADGPEGRLVSLHTFDEPWDMWEMHPHGSELVVCLDGALTLHQELASGTSSHVLDAGQAVVNPPGIWHTADADAPAQVLFITAGEGTEHRPRDAR